MFPIIGENCSIYDITRGLLGFSIYSPLYNSSKLCPSQGAEEVTRQNRRGKKIISRMFPKLQLWEFRHFWAVYGREITLHITNLSVWAFWTQIKVLTIWHICIIYAIQKKMCHFCTKKLSTKLNFSSIV